jgi:hypothetical protein
LTQAKRQEVTLQEKLKRLEKEKHDAFAKFREVRFQVARPSPHP